MKTFLKGIIFGSLVFILIFTIKAFANDKHENAECIVNSSDKVCSEGLVCVPFNEHSGNGKCEPAPTLEPTITTEPTITVGPSVTPTVTPTLEPTVTATPEATPTPGSNQSSGSSSGDGKSDGQTGSLGCLKPSDNCNTQQYSKWDGAPVGMK